MRALATLLVATLLVAALIAPAAQAQQTITMTDLKIDGEALSGQVIRVRARVQPMGSTIFLTDPAIQFDTSGMMGEMEQLDRATRALIVSSCSMGCDMTVTGQVSNTIMGPSLSITAATR